MSLFLHFIFLSLNYIGNIEHYTIIPDIDISLMAGLSSCTYRYLSYSYIVILINNLQMYYCISVIRYY